MLYHSCSIFRCDKKCDLVIYESGDAPKWFTFTKQMRCGYIANVTTDQIAYATQASEGAYVVSQNRKLEVKLEILRENYQHSDEKMYVAFPESQSRVLGLILSEKSLSTSDGVTVEFEVKHSYFDAMVKAVNRIPPVNISRILPTPADFHSLMDISVEIVLSLLDKMPPDIRIHPHDEDQFRALCTILSCIRKSPPVIVNGLFGTGKTRLLAIVANCVLQYGMDHGETVRVLVCAHHQASANYFMENFFGPMFSNRKNVQLVRLMSMSYHVKQSSYRHLYKTGYNYTSQVTSPLPQYLVIVTTFLTAPSLLRVFQAGDFTHILLDEGSQSREPETIAPLSLAGPNTKLVVAGDPHQVKHTCMQCGWWVG